MVLGEANPLISTHPCLSNPEILRLKNPSRVLLVAQGGWGVEKRGCSELRPQISLNASVPKAKRSEHSVLVRI